jgi:hypothetical protein
MLREVHKTRKLERKLKLKLKAAWKVTVSI